MHQQIRICIRRILIYKIPIRRKQILAGSVISLLWHSGHRNIIGCERQYSLHSHCHFHYHMYIKMQTVDSPLTATRSVLCRDDRWQMCCVSSQRRDTRLSTLQHTVISCTTSLMKSGSALAASSTSAGCSLRLCANTRFRLWPAQPSHDWSFVASFMLAVLSVMYVHSLQSTNTKD